MAKTPPATPNSDIDGVDEDRHHVVDAANKAGQGTDDLERAKDESTARPKEGDPAGSAK